MAQEDRFGSVSTNTFPSHRVTNLVSDFARPLCPSLAAMATGASSQDASLFKRFRSRSPVLTAEPFDSALRIQADVANMELRKHFNTGPVTLRDSGFVALAHILPCLLANVWLALLQHSDEWSRLHGNPDLIALCRVSSAKPRLIRTSMARKLKRVSGLF